MNSIKLFLFLILLCLTIFNCKKRELISEKFTGFWAETKWTFQFEDDGSYILKSEGHGGSNPKYGQYFFKDSIIVLVPNTEYFEDYEFKRFKLVNKDCIRDYWGNYYCKKEDTLNKISNKRFKEIEEAVNLIESLELVKSTRNELTKSDSTKKYTLSFEGIKSIELEDFHEYNLKSWFPEYKRYQIHLRFYTKFDPMRIYNDTFKIIN